MRILGFSWQRWRGVGHIAVFLLPCLLIVAWWCSYPKPIDLDPRRTDPLDGFGYVRLGDRFMLRSINGTLRFQGIPSSPAPDIAEAQRWAQRLRNDHVAMRFDRFEVRGGFKLFPVSLGIQMESGPLRENHPEFDRLSNAAVTRAFLDALRDPDRFAAAGVVLYERYQPRWAARVLGGDDVVTNEGQGIRFQYRRDQASDSEIPVEVVRPDLPPVAYRKLLRIFPEYMPELRRKWQRQLSVPLFSVPYWILTLVSVVPIAWIGWTKWRSKAMLAGHCPKCKYDLRAGHTHCPECGEQVAPPGGELNQVADSLHTPCPPFS